MKKQEIFNQIISEIELKEDFLSIIINLFDDAQSPPLKWYDQYVIICAIITKITNQFETEYFKILFKILKLSKHDKIKEITLLGVILGSLNAEEKELKKILNDSSISFFRNSIKLQKIFCTMVLMVVKFTPSKEETISFNYISESYFDNLYKWFIPVHKDFTFLKQQISKSDKQGIDTNYFSELLVNSISLNKEEKNKVISRYPDLHVNQILELIKVFMEEKQKFTEFVSLYPDQMELTKFSFTLKELYSVHKQNETFDLDKVIKNRQNFPIVLYANLVLKENIYKEVGKVLIQTNKFKQAITFFKKYLSFEPKNFDTLKKIAMCYSELNDNKNAVKYYLNSIEIDPNNIDVLYRIAREYEKQKDYNQALKYYFKFYDIDKEKVVLNRIAICYQKLKEYRNAIKYWKKRLEIESNNLSALNGIASNYKNLSNHKKALEFFHRIEDIEPNDRWVLYGIAYSWRGLNKFERAKHYVDKIKKLYGNESEAQHYLGWYYFTQKEFDKAEDYFQKTLKTNKKEKHSLMNLGHIELVKGNKQKAINFYKESIKYYDINDFIEGMKEDYSYISHKISKDSYNKIILNLNKGTNP